MLAHTSTDFLTLFEIRYACPSCVWHSGFTFAIRDDIQSHVLVLTLLGAGMGINDLVTGVAYCNIFSKKEISRKLSIQLTLTHIFVGVGPLYCGMIRDFSSITILFCLLSSRSNVFVVY